MPLYRRSTIRPKHGGQNTTPQKAEEANKARHQTLLLHIIILALILSPTHTIFALEGI